MDDIFAYILIGAVFGMAVALLFLKLIKRRKVNRRMQRAKRGEIKAVNLLEKNGYQIVDIQKEGFYTLEIDDKPHIAKVKADLIISKGNRTFVAEVKTGEKATSPRNIDTRRQLLEYYLVYKPHGIILVDMEKEQLRHVKYTFENSVSSKADKIIRFFVVLSVGFVIGFLTRG